MLKIQRVYFQKWPCYWNLNIRLYFWRRKNKIRRKKFHLCKIPTNIWESSWFNEKIVIVRHIPWVKYFFISCSTICFQQRSFFFAIQFLHLLRSSTMINLRTDSKQYNILKPAHLLLIIQIQLNWFIVHKFKKKIQYPFQPTSFKPLSQKQFHVSLEKTVRMLLKYS